MTTILHLGVIDLPYVANEIGPVIRKRVAKARQGKQKPRKSKSATVTPNSTTGDVATILENKYHVLETFYEHHEEEIGEAFAEAMVGSLESLVVGAPIPPNPLIAAEAKIETAFHKFLESKGMDELGIPGVPTKAALRGVSHRFKRKRGSPRPSFIDTGLYESSMKAWTENTHG